MPRERRPIASNASFARRGAAVLPIELGPSRGRPRLLLAADVHLITLRDPFVGYVLPSKVHACIESGKRILFIGSPSSDVHLLANAGAAVRTDTIASMSVTCQDW